MSDDELELNTMGNRKTALFLIMSDTDTTFNFVIAMLKSQLFNLLCDKADDVYGGRLPVHVRCLLDEFANIGQIPNFGKLIATIRSREISELLGTETIDNFNQSENWGSQVSHGLNYQKLGKDVPYLFVKSSVALNFT